MTDALIHRLISRAVMPISVVLLAATIAGTSASSIVHAQRRAVPAAEANIWQGVYTNAQAARGEGVYQAICSRCHGAALDGGRQGGIPPLTGDPFLGIWEAASLGNLFTKVKDTMPRDAPGSLTNEVYLDLIAYILKANAFPAGTVEPGLTDGVVDNIRIERKEGQKNVPNFALVEIVGCLTAGSDNAWTLTATSEPMVTKEDVPNARELKVAESRPLGTQSVRLLSTAPFKPDLHAGHKMQARGLLNRTPAGNRLDLTSLQMVAPACAN